MGRLRIALLAGLILLSVQGMALGVDLKYAGSTTVQMGFMYDAAALYKKLTNKTISIMGGSSSAGVRGVVMGTIDIGGASRALKPRELAMGVVPTTVAWDAIAVIVNRKNPVKELTMQQLKDIFTGDTLNWKEVGGPDKPIVVITSHVGSATKAVVKKIVMKGRPYVKTAIAVNSTRDEVDQVMEHEFGIGAVSISFADPAKVKILPVDGVAPIPENVSSGKYKIARPLNLLTFGKPKGEAKRFIDFMLSPKGQKLVAKKFIPVR